MVPSPNSTANSIGILRQLHEQYTNRQHNRRLSHRYNYANDYLEFFERCE